MGYVIIENAYKYKKELPILFNTEMVRAILDGRKTQTRRVNKQLNHPYFETFCYDFDRRTYGITEFTPDGQQLCQVELPLIYSVNDVLWVRETWVHLGSDSFDDMPPGYWYKADLKENQSILGVKWRPSIHMPKEIARLFLRVTDVRVERLQDISDADAKAEGSNWRNGRNVGFEEKMRTSAIGRFREAWDCICAKKGYGWETNPWVWVYTFERV